MNSIIKKFRDKLNSGDFVYGVFMKTQDPMFVEIQGIADFDFTILDTEHGPGDVTEQQNNIRASLVRNMLPIVRVNEISESAIGKALDIGALGVQVPQIENAEQAKEAVRLSRFYPYGERGVCRFVRAADYSAKDRDEYFQESKDLVVILQLEGVEAIRNIDEILEVEGIDIIFIGPYDLSQSLGVPGDIKNPKVLNEMMKIIDKAKAKNIVVGTFTDDFEMVLKWKKLGVQYISYSTDSGLFYEYSRDMYNSLNMCGRVESKSLVLDCTLRDGGYVNDWKFGQKNIKTIISSLENANINFIECGFLGDYDYSAGYTRFNSLDPINKIIGKKNKTNYVVMVNYGNYGLEKIPEYCGYGINCIRVAFHKKDMVEALEYSKGVKEKGYKVFIQAMVTSNYTDNEFEYLIKKCNEFNPFSLYVVDSFGTMKRKELLHYYIMLERLLNNEIYPGFHSHNNMQLSFSNVITLLDEAKREFIIDSSVYGMGRGAGNLNTEILVEYLNDNYDGRYQLAPILETMDSVINKVFNKNSWGYSLPNYLSASYNCHPYYAKYLDEKNNLSVNDINNIFAMLDVDKKMEFDKEYIEALYESYLDNPVDENDFYKVRDLLKDKDIVVVTPGKSLRRNKEFIQKERENGAIIISVNFMYDKNLTDYIFMGNIRRMNELSKEYWNRVISTSNIPNKEVFAQIGYSKLLNDQDYVKDNSGFMLLKLLKLIHCKKVTVVGMDGYSYSSDNYSSNDLEISTSIDQIDNMNFGMQVEKKRYKEDGVIFIND